jgi:hypothetical protein
MSLSLGVVRPCDDTQGLLVRTRLRHDRMSPAPPGHISLMLIYLKAAPVLYHLDASETQLDD